MSRPNTAGLPILLYVYALLLAAIALALLIGGVELMTLGGSVYYALSGLVLLGAAGLMFARKAAGARLFGLFIAATVAWAIWEVGFSGWELMPRVIAPAVFGIGLLFPWIRRPLGGLSAWPTGSGLGKGLGLLAGAVLAGTALHAAVGPFKPIDPIYQTGMTGPKPGKPVPGLDGTDWPVFSGTLSGSRFTPLQQIGPDNVGQLEVAWTYHFGRDPKGAMTTMEAAPLKVGDTVYSCTDYNDVFALNAETGAQKWRYRSGNDMSQSKYTHCRGVTYYAVPGASGQCATRVYTTTLKGILIALDAQTGAACPGFGTNGQVNLYDGLGTTDPGYYNVTSAPTLVRGKLVLGAMVADGQHWMEPSGVIRAFDAVTGSLAWAWDMGRPDRTGAPPPGETYTPSTPNSWSAMSADEELGLVYAPTGNASGADYYGVQRRPFDDKYNSSVVALDADTGRVRWSFQTTHHDLWDYDVPSQPVLVDVPRADGSVEKALIQPTKRGEMFYLDRATGAPLAKVEERKVPTRGALPEERISPTQPFSVGMPAVGNPQIVENDMWGITPLDQLWCRLDFRRSRYDGTFTPPGLTRSIFTPSYGGGSNWGSVSVDRDRNVMIANAMRMATRARLMPRAEADKAGLKALAPGVKIDMSGSVVQAGLPYAAEISPMLSPLGVPCTAPPYGTISAVDLTTKKLLWTKPLGLASGSGPMGYKSHMPLPMGLLTFGGALTTRTGLTFIASSPDGYLRAFDTQTGKVVWRTKTPAPAFSTPISYVSPASGRQFIVIAAAGNDHFGTTMADTLVAYALPKKR